MRYKSQEESDVKFVHTLVNYYFSNIIPEKVENLPIFSFVDVTFGSLVDAVVVVVVDIVVVVFVVASQASAVKFEN